MTERVTYITECNGYGGAEKYLLYLIADLKTSAGEVSVAFPFRPANVEFRDELAKIGVRTLDLPQFKALYPLNFLIALRFFARCRADVYHFSLPYADSCRWMLAAAALLSKSYVITEHLVPPDPFKAGAYFAVTHLLFNWLKKRSYRSARAVSAVSAGNRDILVQKYGMPQEKLTVIHNGIDCTPCNLSEEEGRRLRKELDIPEEGLVLTCIARLVPQKGHQYLLDALDEVLKEGHRPTLLVVGDGPLQGPLQKQAERQGIAASVRFAGFREDIKRILAVTDIFVLPSLNEGFPLTLLEAMAAGKPIVATRVTGSAEALVHRETGMLCDPASPDALAGEILALLKDPALRARLGERAGEVARARYDVQVMVRRTCALYGVAL